MVRKFCRLEEAALLTILAIVGLVGLVGYPVAIQVFFLTGTAPLSTADRDWTAISYAGAIAAFGAVFGAWLLTQGSLLGLAMFPLGVLFYAIGALCVVIKIFYSEKKDFIPMP